MAYQSLYRRFRPRRFAELRGQPHVAAALKNAVREGRVSHAYLFSGPRGTGKTSTARILAKALNCEHPSDGEPCCECDSCIAVEEGRSFDIHELDAASHNRVDDIRELVERAALGTPGRTKVYILDEVHMLSTAASNALLKTLEEPPEHVVFVLATTDPQKVLPTIRSRTQHFEFHLLPGSELRDLVETVIREAGLEVDDEAVEYVLRRGAGSARDTLSALEQVVATGGSVVESRGSDEIVAALRDGDPAAALRSVAAVIDAGVQPRAVADDLIRRLREIFLVQMGADPGPVPDTRREELSELATSLGPRAVTRSIELLGEAIVDMRNAPDPRVPLELALVRACRPELDRDLDALAARVERLERLTGASGGPAASAGVVQGDVGGRSAPGAAAVRPSPKGGSRKASREASGERMSPAEEARRLLKGGAESPAPDRRRGEPRDQTVGSAPRSTSADPPSNPRVRGAGGAARAAASGVATVEVATPEVATPEVATAEAVEADPVCAPSRDEITLVWADEILPSLTPPARARFKVGRFLPSDNGTAVFAVPDEGFLRRCRELAPEVEEQLSRRFGTKVRLRVVVDDGSAPPREFQWTGALDGGSGGRASRERGEASGDEAPGDVSDAADPRVEAIAVDELEDADPATTLERIQRFFPGARIVDS
ncbi:MAG: hypothetical protein KatS3mg008_1270 [Acidimicrobiales bacterium]|nr:MAG: hypothetical protein KatS3mg008_1270 [Acidimicrobiales bacterium]